MFTVDTGVYILLYIVYICSCHKQIFNSFLVLQPNCIKKWGLLSLSQYVGIAVCVKEDLPHLNLIGVPTEGDSADSLACRTAKRVVDTCSKATIAVGLEAVQWHPPSVFCA